jgi:hypothetical protein
MNLPRLHSSLAGAALAFLLSNSAVLAEVKPPAGFTALFNGTDLAGWRGGSTFDPRKLAAMPEDARLAQLEKWTATMRSHWRAEGEELINDGKGDYATTDKEYGDFELLLEYKTVPLADSGVYLRGAPQIQIWDSTEEAKFKIGADKGSGGLWNNSPGTPGKDPLVKADKPFGEWNAFRIVMIGSRVSVWLNGQMVVDHATMENYYDRATALPARGPIELQTHGGEIRWRNIFIREIGSEEANKTLAAKAEGPGFKSLFNGNDLTGWQGAVDNYEVQDGALVCKPGKGGNLLTKDQYADFIAQVEFKLPPGGNNGLAIRCPLEGNTAYLGMTELQVLDDNYEKVRGPIDPRQAHGSAYGLVAAQRGYQHLLGEWNFEEVTVKGSTLKVELNGTVILNADLSTVDMATVMAKSAHPGKDRPSGFFGFAGHSDPVMFRAVRIKSL